MGNDIVSPLSSIVRRAKTNIPANGIIAIRQERIAAGSAHFIAVIVDVSGSMGTFIENGRRKIDVLQVALDSVLVDFPTAIVFAFSSIATKTTGKLPEPGGNTALHIALDVVAKDKPVRTLVISDGEPDNKELAFRSAQSISGIIDTLYIGPDDNVDAKKFMNELARCTGGRSARSAMTTKLLERNIRVLLPDLRGADR